ncbi:MAG: heavy metal translocating P-type ATPase [Alphaproteobacteria bacterium]|nr:heavy metal translocating P-type ATPase [Alphaproteobacteria bacterium]
MSCCVSKEAYQPPETEMPEGYPTRDEVLFASTNVGDGLVETHIFVPGMHCGGCLAAVEKAMAAIPCVKHARVNLSSKRLVLHWTRQDANPRAVLDALTNLGYQAHLDDGSGAGKDKTLSRLLFSLAVAGFAAANVMLLSVSIWSGAEGATRDMFHWISALIAIPAVAYAGQPFFRPAFRALRGGHLTMDVPISLAVLLALGMSLYETSIQGENAYFDASITLLFFLLIGRVLDHVMRERARGAVASLGRMAPSGATVISDDGSRDWVPLDAVAPGMNLFVAPGQYLPVDGVVVAGGGEVDCAIATGESDPVPAAPGKSFPAGALAIGAPIVLRATRSARQSFLAEMVSMLEAAESAKPAFRRLSDRAAAIYAPMVHLAALLTFIGWVVATGDWHRAVYTAIAVLIITCPCALGLAVPIVQVVAAGRLARNGILLSDGAALEKLAQTDRVLFDKTGTLTTGHPTIRDGVNHNPKILRLAGSVALASRHPYSRALVTACEGLNLAPAQESWDSLREEPGKGVEAIRDGVCYRLGKASWALKETVVECQDRVVFSRDGKALDFYSFEETVREGAPETVTWLQAQGFSPELVSGDSAAKVRMIADSLGISVAQGDMSPADKIARIQSLQASGHRVLMVGDGINDAPALNAADASIAPSTASDVGRRASGFVFLSNSLDAVRMAIAVSRQARTLIYQNFGLAIVYNLVAVPIAVAGFATPLVAAIAMSGSSCVVIANAMRLNLISFSGKPQRKTAWQKNPLKRRMSAKIAGEVG